MQVNEGGSGGKKTAYDKSHKTPKQGISHKQPLPTPKQGISHKRPLPKIKKSNELGQAGLDKSKYTNNTKTSTTVKKTTTPKAKTVTKKTPVKTVTLPKTSTKTKTGTKTGTGTKTKPSNLDTFWNQAQGYKTVLDKKLKDGFHYDPATDPSYQALEKIATANADKASKQSMEDMNDRGIFNSSITTDRDAQIKQSYQDSVTAQIPGLQQAAYGQWRDDVTTYDNLWTQSMNNWSGERNFQEGVREYNKTFNEGVRQYDQTYAAGQKQQAWQNNFQQSQADIGNSYKANQLTIDEISANQKQYGVTSKKSTNKALAEITGKNFKTGKEAMKWLGNNAQKYYDSGADFTTIVSTLTKRYPDFSTKGLSLSPSK